MRELTQEEIQQVHGGVLINTAFAAISIGGAYYGAKEIGNSINQFNNDQFGMSLGEALYRTFN